MSSQDNFPLINSREDEPPRGVLVNATRPMHECHSTAKAQGPTFWRSGTKDDCAYCRFVK